MRSGLVSFDTDFCGFLRFLTCSRRHVGACGSMRAAGCSSAVPRHTTMKFGSAEQLVLETGHFAGVAFASIEEMAVAVVGNLDGAVPHPLLHLLR